VRGGEEGGGAALPQEKGERGEGGRGGRRESVGRRGLLGLLPPPREENSAGLLSAVRSSLCAHCVSLPSGL